MRRNLSAAVLAAMQEGGVRLRLLYEGYFKNGVARYWTGRGPVEWDEKTFTGFGDLMGVSNAEETTDIKANGVTVSIAGVTDQSIALSLNEGQRGKPGQVWLAFMYPNDGSGAEMISDDDGEDVLGRGSDIIGQPYPANRIILDPVTVFRGRLDGVDIPDSVEAASISATYVHELQTLERPKTVRYTDQEQKRLYPDDKGLEFIVDLQDAVIPWGAR
jgi:hypothetical protein